MASERRLMIHTYDTAQSLDTEGWFICHQVLKQTIFIYEDVHTITNWANSRIHLRDY